MIFLKKTASQRSSSVIDPAQFKKETGEKLLICIVRTHRFTSSQAGWRA